MRYNYDVGNECFVREDGLGKKFFVNITEAQRIMTLYDLGYGVPQIKNKITFASDKVYESTITNFINNVENGNITLDGDYPAPKFIVDELTVDNRIDKLEERVNALEEKLNSNNLRKISWRERLGL